MDRWMDRWNVYNNNKISAISFSFCFACALYRQNTHTHIWAERSFIALITWPNLQHYTWALIFYILTCIGTYKYRRWRARARARAREREREAGDTWGPCRKFGFIQSIHLSFFLSFFHSFILPLTHSFRSSFRSFVLKHSPTKISRLFLGLFWKEA